VLTRRPRKNYQTNEVHMNILAAVTAVVLLGSNIHAADKGPAVEPTSEIPAKRVFPLSKTEMPCEDFHKYVCSNAEAAFKLREDRSMHDFAFNDSSERILQSKKDFFSHIQKEKHLSARDQQVKDYYQACMNVKDGIKQEKAEITQLQTELGKVKTVADFLNLNVANIWNGDDSLFMVGTDPNKDNPKVYDIILMTKLMNLPEHSYYEDAALMKDYRKLIIDFFHIVEPKAKDIEQRADGLIAFEKEFVKIYPHPEVLRQRWSEKRQTTQEEFVKKYGNLGAAQVTGKFPPSLLVSNPVPEALDFLLAHSDEKSLPTLKDFYLVHFGYQTLDDSNPAYFQRLFDFNKKYLGGPIKRPDRDERCTRRIMHDFNRELDAILLPRMFPNFPEEKVRNVAAKIKESIIAGVNANTWLSDESKKKAILKIQTAKLYLVKPQTDKEWDFTPTKKYSASHRIENEKLRAKAGIEKDLEEAKGEVNMEAWDMGPLTVNAYYNPSANKFVLPVGILQYPFFVTEGDLTENLGAVGTVFGHELGHGIDDQGAKYDETGKLNQWMSLKEVGEFQKRGQRMVEYFNKAHHNGALTLGENIADNVGLTFAYNAAFPKGIGSVEDKQRFFVAFARLWCYKALPKAEEFQIKTNPHSLGWARINEQMKHQPGFIEAFQCKKGDPMFLTPEDQVKIW